MEVAIVIPVTLALFLAIITFMAAKSKSIGKLAGTFIGIAAAGGLGFYGYGFAVTTPGIPLAVIRTLLAVCGMYMGKNELSAISAAPGMGETWAVVLFQVVHLCAIYATVSTAIAAVGAGALRKLRLWMARGGRMYLIYGVSDDTLALGNRLLEKKQGAVVFIDDKTDPASVNAIAKAGCVLLSDSSALAADGKFMKTVGATNKKSHITLYAMSHDPSQNLQYAMRLVKSLEASGFPAEKSVLVIRGQENSAASSLQVLGEKYGYGSVSVVQGPALAARILMQNYPPCDHITFDENGKARENFEALVVGFGQVGQAVLRQLVMNGQFEGSNFKASVFAPDCNSVKGHFSRSFGQALKNYDITFYNCDGRSEELYDRIDERGEKIKYLVLCTGSEKVNHEIADDLSDYFAMRGISIPMYLCTNRGVSRFAEGAVPAKRHSLYLPEVLSMEGPDELAMLVNHHYQGDPACGAAVTWRDCDYFSRMSCRASADFVPAMLRIAGTSAEAVAEKGWDLTEKQLENMSRTEHLRWCAFHYCMGFSAMTEEEYGERAALYRQQVAAGQKPLRLGKDMQTRRHACLVSWEALDELSKREESVTGKAVDYKQMDTENILVIPKLLKTMRENKA